MLGIQRRFKRRLIFTTRGMALSAAPWVSAALNARHFHRVVSVQIGLLMRYGPHRVVNFDSSVLPMN